MTLQCKQYSLPSGWANTQIQNVCSLTGGGTPSRTNPEFFGGDIIWLTPTEISKDQIIQIFDSREKITKLGLQKSSAKVIPKDAVLLTSRASIGFVAIAGKDVTTNQGFASFICSDIIHNYFLAYWLWANRDLLIQNATGTTFKEITKSSIRQLRINIPPLPEQRRIVHKIESIFAQIDACQERLERLAAQTSSVSGNLARLRSSVLKQAFEGRLVSQDPKNEHAAELLKRIGKDSGKKLEFETKGVPEGWIQIPLSHIAQINPTKPKNHSEINDVDVSFVPMKNVSELTGIIDHSETRKYHQVRKGYTYFEDNDIIFAKITPCMENGKIAIATKLKNGIGFGSTEFHVIRLLCAIPRKFYFYYLMQDGFRNQAQQKMKGTAGQLRVPADYLDSARVPLPPLSEQHRIVSKIESIFAKIDAKQKELERIETHLKPVFHNLNELKSSILKLAFEGKLVPQDPNDEPASVFLDQIYEKKLNPNNQKN